LGAAAPHHYDFFDRRMTVEKRNVSSLYRGVSSDIHRQNDGRLLPKTLEMFTYAFNWGGKGLKWGSGATYGSSPTNAVIRHQLNQEGFPTSGVSTTPSLERAMVYARGLDGTGTGVVYKIDCARLDTHRVTQYVVAEYAKYPSVSVDEEVILVSADFGPLPNEIIAEVIQIETS